MKKPRLTTQQVADELGVCTQRILKKIDQGHFPGASRCECGRSMMIPREDVDRDVRHRGSKKQREKSSEPV